MPAAIPYVVAVVAAAASAYNTKKTADKQDQVAAAGIRTQAANQREINQRLNKTIEDASKSTPDEERAKAQAEYTAQIQRHLGQAKTGLTSRGLSDQFDQQATAEGGQVSDYGGTLADLFSRMDAPILQRQNEGNSYGNLGMDLMRLGGNVSGDEFLNKLKFGAIRRNPWIDLASSIGSSYAGSGGGGGGYTGMAGSMVGSGSAVSGPGG